jgi:glucosamine 6-phosphate synthetase-like amidotransferase/phosphosugar isomerase protein
LTEVEGSYAVIALHVGCDELIVARKGSPLIIGLGDKEYY